MMKVVLGLVLAAAGAGISGYQSGYTGTPWIIVAFFLGMVGSALVAWEAKGHFK